MIAIIVLRAMNEAERSAYVNSPSYEGRQRVLKRAATRILEDQLRAGRAPLHHADI